MKSKIILDNVLILCKYIKYKLFVSSLRKRGLYMNQERSDQGDEYV